MTSQWSSEFTVTEHRDLQASAMTMDWDGTKILLAGKRQIAVKNLNDSSDMKKFPQLNKYEVVAAEWNPTIGNGHFCALAANQRIELLCWREVDLEPAHVLKGHTRQVSDINWHRFDPNVLASSSVDTYTHVWDIRDPRRPCLSFAAVSSCSHVRWNKLSSFILGTAHDGDIRIWDQRKGTAPIQYIAAHLAKIHGLDWSPTHEYQLASCSQDGTIKFFDMTNPKRAESVIQTSAPVWRARYTPFGEGLLTVVVPQSRRAENSLLLWNLAGLSNQSAPVHTFVGHSDVVLEFDWRQSRAELREYQLVTWSKDQSLRMWKIEPFLQKLCGHDWDGDSHVLADDEDYVHITDHDLPSTDSNGLAALDTGLPAVESMGGFSLSESSSSHLYLERAYGILQDPSKSVEHEFSLLSTNASPNIKMQDMDGLNRSCVVSVTVNTHCVTLQVTFPPSYPYNAAPSFQIDETSTVDSLLKTKLLKVLKQTAQQRVRKNRICLESCLSQLVSTLEHTTQLQESEAKQASRVPPLGAPPSSPEGYNMYGSAHDAHVPFPKTCGARFCSVGMLVCFHRVAVPRRVNSRPDGATPRSLSAVGSIGRAGMSYHTMYMAGSSQDAVDAALPYYIQDRNRSLPRGARNGSTQAGGRTHPPKPAKNITIYDASKLFFIHRELGERYVLNSSDVAASCLKNASAAAAVGRQDLVQVWTLASLVATPASQGTEVEDDVPWHQHPFSRSQIEYLIFHYAKMSDIQTAAMLCCTFSSKMEPKGLLANKTFNSKSVSATPGGSPYHTIHPADTTLEGWNFPTLKQNRSNSWSESVDDLKLMANIVEHREMTEGDHERNKILDDRHFAVYDEFKRKYADILHMWNLLEARVQVTKLLSTQVELHKVVQFVTECQNCSKTVYGPSYCSSCKRFNLRCALCRILVKGSSNLCLACGHGGHAAHIMSWFKTETVCPTGCGCKCLVENGNLIES